MRLKAAFCLRALPGLWAQQEAQGAAAVFSLT